MMDCIEVFKGLYVLRYGIGFGVIINFVFINFCFIEEVDIYGWFFLGYEGNGEVFWGES